MPKEVMDARLTAVISSAQKKRIVREAALLSAEVGRPIPVCELLRLGIEKIFPPNGEFELRDEFLQSLLTADSRKGPSEGKIRSCKDPEGTDCKEFRLNFEIP